MSKQNDLRNIDGADSDVTIGQFIGRMMDVRGITVEEMAERLGISRQAIDYWRSGQSDPSPRRYGDIAEILGISVEELVARRMQPLENQAESRIRKELNSLSESLSSNIVTLLGVVVVVSCAVNLVSTTILFDFDQFELARLALWYIVNLVLIGVSSYIVFVVAKRPAKR